MLSIEQREPVTAPAWRFLIVASLLLVAGGVTGTFFHSTFFLESSWIATTLLYGTNLPLILALLVIQVFTAVLMATAVSSFWIPTLALCLISMGIRGQLQRTHPAVIVLYGCLWLLTLATMGWLARAVGWQEAPMQYDLIDAALLFAGIWFWMRFLPLAAGLQQDA